MKKNLLIISVLLLCSLSGTTKAGTITTYGDVTALTNIDQLVGVYGMADFNIEEGSLPLHEYTDQGLTFLKGNLGSNLIDVWQPKVKNYTNSWTYFPVPVAGGASWDGCTMWYGGVADFSDGYNVTQFGLTAGRNGTQYLTAFRNDNTMIGSVQWSPTSTLDSAFVGIHTGGDPIARIAWGNDNLWSGGNYSPGGPTIMSDNWIWASGGQPVPEPSTMLLLASGLIGLAVFRRKFRER